MDANSIKIECEEDGFHLIVRPFTMDDSVFDFHITDPEALYDHVKAAIGPWLMGRQWAADVREAFECDPEERVVAIREDGSYRTEPDEEPADWRERRGLMDMRRDLGRAPTAQEWQDERR